VSPTETGVAQPGRSRFERLASSLRSKARPLAGRLRLRDQGGFTLIEAVLAMTLFAIVSVSLTGVLTSSVNAQGVARSKTLAEQVVNDQIEWIRQQDYYNNVGLVNGNPPGTINSTGLKNVSGTIQLTGLKAIMTTQISLVNDPTPGSFATSANYKKVTVTLVRASDSKLLARQVTYVAPPGQAPFAGINLAIVNATVIDMGGATSPLPGVGVLLASGPSSPSNDVTDAAGNSVFPALIANPTSGATAYYNLILTPPSGYTVLKDDDVGLTPASPAARVQLSPGQTWTTSLRVYQGCTINVQLIDQSTGLAYTGAANVTVSSSRGSQTFAYSGGMSSITQIAGENVVPGLTYTVMVAGGFYATALAQAVPNNYPTDLTKTFVLNGYPTGTVTSTVTWGGAVVSGATVQLTGGPTSLNQSATTNASGVATFTDIPAGSGYTATATKTGQSAAVAATVAASTTTNIPIALPTGSVATTVTWAGTGVNGATVTLAGGPMSVNVSGTTNSSGQLTFVNVPAGTGYTVTATKSGQTASASGVSVTGGSTTNVSIAMPTGTMVVTVNWAGSPVNGATVTVSGGNLVAPVTGTTNSSGVVTFVNVPAGTGYTVTATSGGQTGTAINQTVTGGATTNVTVPMPTGSVAVNVKWGGANVANCTNCVTLSGGNLSASVTGSTDASGNVTFINVPAGTGYTVTATTSGQSASATGQTVTNGATTNVSLALPTGTLVVNVTSGGSAVNGATVSVTGGPMPITSQTTNSSGQTTFTNVPVSSTYTVTATTGTQTVSQSSVSVTSGATTTISLAFPLGTVAVNVQWAGLPVANCTNCVTLSGGALSVPVTGSTDASGNVSFLNVPASTGYTVTATKGGQTGTQSGITVSGGTTTNVNIAMPTGSVAVNVKWGGANVASCASCVTLSGGNLSASVTGSTDASGNVTFINVPAGTGYTVTATKTGQTGTVSGQTVTNGATTPVNVTLPTGSFLVTVNQPAGTPAPNATVTLTLGPMLVNVSGTTNASGQITFANVPTGTGYTIVATRYGQTVTVVNQTVATGATTNVTMNLAAYLKGSIAITVKKSGGTTCNSTSFNWTISGGPYSYSVNGTASTSAAGVLPTVANIPAGTLYTVTVAKVSNAAQNGSTASVTVTSGGTAAVTVTLNTNTCP
jgi:type II secretory pathway pseudopilin PulG